ncbi:MAG: FtsB family cell division protein [Acidimicrobiia bacterium]
MTAPRRAAAAVFAPRPAPAPTAEPPRRPLLHVVPEPAAARRLRLLRLGTAVAFLAALFGLFGVVGLHVLLAQGQGDVQKLSAQVAEQEEVQRRLRLQVAELEAPAKVVAEARERLGMVSPPTVVPLRPATLADPPATTIPGPRPTTTTSVPVTATPPTTITDRP